MKHRHPVTVIAHLSGRYRGKIQRLSGDRLRIGTSDDAEIRFSAEDLTPGLSELPAFGPYAVLERRGDTYELQAALEADIWINGRRAERRLLRSGDMLEIGEGGPVLRFRLYPPGSRAYKSVSEVFSDCAECVRHGRSTADRAGLLLAGPPMELLTRTSPLVRIATVAVLISLMITVGYLWMRSQRLERHLIAETKIVEEIASLLERGDLETISSEDVDALRAALSDSASRIRALEERSDARARVIAASARSVVFIQAAWGLDGEDGRPLRFVVGPGGQPLQGPAGPQITLDGEGPPVEILYTGTAFVVSADGQLLTNRHVALPWDYDAGMALLASEGLVPVMRRFVGYLPGRPDPFDVHLIRSSDSLDVALLQCDPVNDGIEPLELTEHRPRPGDEVIVLGYPLGIDALVARADPAAVQSIFEQGALDFWQVARQLSNLGLIEPLATVGVVGQVNPASVVYDAETAHGGSGGPVLDLEGQVLAVNAAVLEKFSGSNMGVPAAEALLLLRAEGEASPD